MAFNSVCVLLMSLLTFFRASDSLVVEPLISTEIPLILASLSYLLSVKCL